jgi:hypothetical protein
VTIDDIKQDMSTFAKQFPIEVIPHITDNGSINDTIHNYRRPKPKEQPHKSTLNSKDQFLVLDDTKKNNALERAKPNLTAENLRTSRKVLKSPEISQLIGLISHLAYWNVFGHFNKLPLDIYHRK